VRIFGNPLTWDDLPWLRSITDLPLVLKGICHPEDARRARDGGVDGIYCSNHGGRQANGGLAALAQRVRRKYSIRNTSGYTQSALLDADTPLEIFRRLIVGSEGTLAFMAEAVIDTLPAGRDDSQLDRAAVDRPKRALRRWARRRPGRHFSIHVSCPTRCRVPAT
jgi:FMN-dependent dehydrogenase